MEGKTLTQTVLVHLLSGSSFLTFHGRRLIVQGGNLGKKVQSPLETFAQKSSIPRIETFFCATIYLFRDFYVLYIHWISPSPNTQLPGPMMMVRVFPIYSHHYYKDPSPKNLMVYLWPHYNIPVLITSRPHTS